MKSLTKEQQRSHENTKKYYICKEKLESMYFKDEKYNKVRDHCPHIGEYRGTSAHCISNLKHSVPKNIPIAFHNGSNYNYHFILKKLAVEFKKQFSCLGESTGKYIAFKVTIEKEVIKN